MPIHASRRGVLLAMAGSLIAGRARAADDSLAAAQAHIALIESRVGARLGVAALDAASGRFLGYHEAERFPMCSTFKWLAAAAALKRVDAGLEKLDRRIPYGPSDLFEYAPVAKAHVAEGAMSLGDLCAAAIQWSDNTAANLVLAAIGGPEAVTAFSRSVGDETTRLDRNEPTLNTSIPGDPRDTTSPLAMARDLRAVLLGEALSPSSRAQLEAWMVGDKVGDKRIRAGLPADWRVGDKTGTGDYGTANVVAILRPPGRAPILAAVYLTQSTSTLEARNAAHRDVGALIAETF